MKSAIVALLLAALPAAALAQDTTASIAESFRGLVATIPADPSVAGQWVLLLPTIARRCRLAIDQERVTAYVDQLAHPEAVDEATDFYAAHPDSRLKASWETMVNRDEEDACRRAGSLWGLHGAQAPGVLRVPTDTTRRKIPKHASGGEIR